MNYECSVCAYLYDEDAEGTPWSELPDDWECPVCGADKSYFEPQVAPDGESTVSPGTPGPGGSLEDYLGQWKRTSDEIEESLKATQEMAITGRSVIEPMRSRKPVISWDEILDYGRATRHSSSQRG